MYVYFRSGCELPDSFEVGGQVQAHASARECGDLRRRATRTDHGMFTHTYIYINTYIYTATSFAYLLGRRGCRSDPHGTHVLRENATRPLPADDSERYHRGAMCLSDEDAAHAAARLHKHLQNDVQQVLCMYVFMEFDLLYVAGMTIIACNRQVTVRLLDPPLHEFLPKRNQTTLESFTYEEELLELSARLGISLDECVVRSLSLSIYLLALTGCTNLPLESHQRLDGEQPDAGVPRLSALCSVSGDHRDADARYLRCDAHAALSFSVPICSHSRAVCVGAALDCMKEGITVSPQIMIPLVCSDHEVSYIVPIIRNAYALVCEQYSSVYGDQVLLAGSLRWLLPISLFLFDYVPYSGRDII